LTDLFEPVIPGVANCAVLKGRWELSLISGGYGEGETPLPISNRAVKPLSADGTWPARARESRTPPVSSPERAARTGRLFCVLAAAGVAPLPRCAARRHAVGLPSTWGLPGVHMRSASRRRASCRRASCRAPGGPCTPIARPARHRAMGLHPRPRLDHEGRARGRSRFSAAAARPSPRPPTAPAQLLPPAFALVGGALG
jgi:hypothetical protein